MIALLCPSRGRPEQLARMVKSAGATTDSTVRNILLCLGISQDDYAAYGAIFSKLGNAYGVAVLPDLMPTAFKWNLLAEEAFKNPDIRLFMLAADDMIFTTPGWDKALTDHYNALENKIHVYALQDSRDKDGTPHIIVTREYIEAMGYFVPPIFLHWFIDSWTVEIAKYNNCFTHMRDYELVHDKPSDAGKPDETHSRIREWGWHDRDQWVNLKCKNTLLVNEMQRLRSIINK